MGRRLVQNVESAEAAGGGLGGNWTCTGEVLAREETAVDYVPLILQPSAFQAVFLFCL